MPSYSPTRCYFYPRSPCGERPPPYNLMIHHAKISIHALLAESDVIRMNWLRTAGVISIHALLAESDVRVCEFVWGVSISIHALLAESDGAMAATITPTYEFLSTLSLRRATNGLEIIANNITYFYPRSPCGERPDDLGDRLGNYCISIHALLAESDPMTSETVWVIIVFLSTLSLRRATSNWFDLWGWAEYFYPRSPCGERLG